MEDDYKVSQSELERRKLLPQKARKRFKSGININIFCRTLLRLQ